MFDEPEKCPFCGNDHLSILDKSFGCVSSFHVYCKNCLCRGPHGVSAEDAANKWNSIKRED